MAKILITYHSTDGHTKEICDRLQQIASIRGHQLTLTPIDQAFEMSLADFDKVVIGASIRYGRHHPLVKKFINQHAARLISKPTVFFSVNLVARKADKCSPQTNPYMRKFLNQISWCPQRLAVFAGKLNYPMYGVLDRTIIRFIMWMTKGPTDTKTVRDFTDWEAVDRLGEVISTM